MLNEFEKEILKNVCGTDYSEIPKELRDKIDNQMNVKWKCIDQLHKIEQEKMIEFRKEVSNSIFS